MKIKVEHSTEVNLKNEVQTEVIRVGIIDGNKLEKAEFNYKVENGKVKVL